MLTETPTTPKPKRKANRPLITAHQLLNSASQQTRAIVKRQVARGTQEIDAHIEEMVRSAKAVLTQASRTGPRLTTCLDNATTTDMSLGDLEVASRVWERLLNTSRKVLKLDEPASQSQFSVNVLIASGAGAMPHAASVLASYPPPSRESEPVVHEVATTTTPEPGVSSR